ncbi:MAG: dTDP-4-dehydrorhamnose reductase [Pseudanabaenaceae cyanobacterium SKYGB_i_bin29]|nr:dTDP-4-dehydrorhamnose reductase [Pseudanabaenaceae cyanobacterium SKYG29]MDW8420825.1 dTDP-4-dehydrorhamnose reductase [Pseudanabaenaceae cyanobacterium SKYGB_i_bin29]
MKILLTGVTGQVGWELQRSLLPLGEVIAPSRTQLDLADPDTIVHCLREIRPEGVINAAAYTAVDLAETEPDLAHRINAVAPGILAEECQRLGAWLIHYSTDYVFDGNSSVPYKPTDPTNPLGAYGKSKRAGELAIAAVGGQYLILRTAWVYGMRGKNFLRTILRLARERQQLRIVNDQVGSPTWSRVIAEVTAHIVPRVREQSGIFHLTCQGSTTWYDFACAILRFDPQRSEQVVTSVEPITTAEYPTPAQRPAYSVLDCSSLEEQFQVHLPPWQTALALALAT